MQAILNHKKQNNLFLLLCVFACLYLVVRTYTVDITDDEAWSYYNVKNFWWVEVLCSGNTHWFNFVAIKIALLFGAVQTWQLRWFSLLCGIGFYTIVFFLLKEQRSFGLKLLVFSLFFFNLYVIEYLTLARGYAAGLMFMMLSLWILFNAQNTQHRRTKEFAALFFAGCSAIANFNFFYFFVAFVCLYMYEVYLSKNKRRLNNKFLWFDLAFILGVSGLVLRALAFIKACSNDIGGFGGDNLFTSVFVSFIDTLLYGKWALLQSQKLVIGISFFVLILTSACYGFILKSKHQNRLFFYSSIVLLIMLGLVTFNYYVFHVLFPTERTALMFYPLFFIVLAGFIDSLFRNVLMKSIIVITLSLMLAINFLLSAKLVSSRDYNYCMYSKQYFDYLKNKPIHLLGIDVNLYFIYLKYHYYTGCDFKAQSINESWVNYKYIFDNKLEDFDYMLLVPPYNLSYYHGKSKVTLKPLKYFNNTRAIIFKVEK